ncbi:MAG: hypothetical protein GXO79_01355 [Chlorobi bacterium]|nr:hypothetical protein [Chlorobiota bacterium]
MELNSIKIIHDKYAPYWAIALLILWVVGISTIWIDLGGFWKGYVLDMTGPAWNYILFRGLFTVKANNIWTHFFTPNRTLIIFLLVCAVIETLQFYNIYNSTYDKWDFLAYVSLLIPLFLIDRKLNQKKDK